jgi:dephospho-CoA kinase
MSGVGKSSVAEALEDRGYLAIDTDSRASRVAPDGEWLWDEREIERLLSLDEEVLFILGSASNQTRYYAQFDCVLLLSAPTEVMLERVAARTTNPYGKTEEEAAKIVADKEAFEPMLRRVASFEVRTDRPLGAVVEDVLRLSRS